MHGEKFNLSKQRLHVLLMNNTVTTCLCLLHCLRQPYPFPHSSLQESSILHHTHFPLIHSPPHSLTYMESHGCMLSFTPSHTQLTQASISIQPTKPFSLSKLSPTYGILPKKCHVALSPLRTQTAPLRRVA